VVREQEPQIVIHVRERWCHDLRRHEIREHLFHPDIGEPPHGHQVAEPHVCRLMGDDAGAAEHLVAGGGRIEKERRGAIPDGAGVLHPAELERGDGEERELPERIGNAGVVLEPAERRGVEVEDRLAVAEHFRGIGLPVHHRERAAVARRLFGLELPGGEREQIRRDRLGLIELMRRATGRRVARHERAVGQRTPAAGNPEGQGPAGLEVGLVERGERGGGAVRNEQRVEELVVPVERLIGRLEPERDGVGPPLECTPGDHHVPGREPWRNCVAVHRDPGDARGVAPKVERQRPARIGEREADCDRAGDGRGALLGNVEGERVAEVADPGRALLGQLERHAVLGSRLVAAGTRGQRRRDQEGPPRAAKAGGH